jgi:hypothetical protein
MRGIGDCLPTVWVFWVDYPIPYYPYTEHFIKKGEEYYHSTKGEEMSKALDKIAKEYMKKERQDRAHT